MNFNTVNFLSVLILVVGMVVGIVILRFSRAITNKVFFGSVGIMLAAFILSFSLQLSFTLKREKAGIAGLNGRIKCQMINPVKIATVNDKKVLFSEEWLILLATDADKNTPFGKRGLYVFETEKKSLFVPSQGFDYQVQRAVGPVFACPKSAYQ